MSREELSSVMLNRGLFRALRRHVAGGAVVSNAQPWLVPLSGDMSREELSSLLLNYLGTAADIIDFLSILSEPNIVKTGPYLYAVLVTWTFSLLQVRVCM